MVWQDKSIEFVPWELPPINTLTASIPAPREAQLFTVYLTKAIICEQSGQKNEAISAYKLADNYLKFNASGLSKTELDSLEKILHDKIRNLGE